MQIGSHGGLVGGVYVLPYAQGNIFNHRSDRERKLLMHRNEIERLHGKSREKGLTIVPLRLYLANGKIKLKLRWVRVRMWSISGRRSKNGVDQDARRALRKHNS